MDALSILFMILTAIGLGIYLWLETKSGKNWLNGE